MKKQSDEFTNAENLAGPDITIPDGYRIIGTAVFSGRDDIKSVTIPDGVISIDLGAFQYCRNLKEVKIPASLIDIDTYAFIGCSALENIYVDAENTKYADEDGVLFNKDLTVLLRYSEGKIPEKTGGQQLYSIPDGVEEIGSYALSGCRHIEAICIPASLAKISNTAFYVHRDLLNGYKQNSDSIAAINVSPGNEAYTDIDGVLFSNDKTVLVSYPKGRAEYEYKIPDGVAELEAFAFSDCESLESISIPDSVKEIGQGCFFGCKNLEQIDMEAHDAVVAPYSFENTAWFNAQPNGVVYVGNIAVCYKGKDWEEND